ncbi:MAG: phytanoyl-CoA dioxygenase family protein [Planctomycetes bacterium]|nr:phytanoyl-CoA dioxygenase family protein [Planctomycetota bacterium]
MSAATTSLPERILAFAPAPERDGKRLRAADVARFNRDGYVLGLDVYSPEEAAANRQAFDRLLTSFQAAGHDSYAINGYHTSCADIWDIAMEPRILDHVEDLLGPDFVIWGTHYFCKMPNDGKAVSWHQDAPYWPLTPSRTVTAWLAIDDADVGNAAMRVIPGSHLHGALPYRQSRPEENNVLWRTIDGMDNGAAAVSMNLRAGQISLHSDLLVHGSLPNTSDRRRCGLTIRYAGAEVRSYDGWNQASMLCRGRDRDGHWANLPRPPGNDVSRVIRAIGGN